MSGENTASRDESAGPDPPKGMTNQTVVALFFTLLYYGILIVSNLFFARHLGEALYGDFSFIMSAIILGSQLVLLGGEETTMRFVPRYFDSGARAKIAGLLRFFFASTIVLCLVSALFLWALIVEEEGFRPHPSRFETTIHLLGLVALCVPIYALVDLGQKILRSFGMWGRSYLPNRLVAPSVTLIVIALAVYLDLSLTVWTIVIAIAVGSSAALVLQVILFRGAQFAKYVKGKAKYEIQPWLSFSIPMMITALMWKLITYGDIVMLELLGPDEASVGEFAAAQSATILLSAVYLSIVTVTAPLISAAAQALDRAGLQAMLSKVVGIVLVFALPFCVLTIVFRDEVMALYGPGYEEASGVLVVMAIGLGINVVLSPSKTFLEYMGWPKLALWPTAVAATANLALDAVFIPLYGIEGAAGVSLLVLVGSALAWVVLLHRAEGLRALPALKLG